MEFAEFVERAAEIEAESADLAIVGLVTDLFRSAGEDLPVLARFVQGRVFPAWTETKLDVGPQSCYEAIARAAGRNVTADDVEARVAERGDVGEVAASYDLGGQRGLDAFGAGDHDPLTVESVYADLSALASAEGDGSQEGKVTLLFGLFNRCSSVEARYLARLVLSEMRIGVGEGAVRDAIATAFDVPTERVERALQVSNDYGEVASVARAEGVAGLDGMRLSVGRPVQAMLAQAGTVVEALDSWESVGVETKYDGARVQLHYDPRGPPTADATDGPNSTGMNPSHRTESGATARAFSRNMEDVTGALPEVVEFTDEHLHVPVILDGEVVAVDDDGHPLPFQAVLRRFRRKHDVDRVRDEVGVEFHAFDCLHADGEDLLDTALVVRRERLGDVLDDGVSRLSVTNDPEVIGEMEADALASGHEGIMLKDPDSPYSPGRRGKRWLKVKPDVETLDLVVTGAEWGEGRRATFLGTFQLGTRTDDGFETIGKVATGITDEELAELTELLEPHVVGQDGRVVDVEPTVVFEVGYEEIQRSPTYSSGYALRFPRFRGVRTDLDPDDADTLDRVERLAGSDGSR